MARLIDITGQRFGRLLVLEQAKPARPVGNPSGYAYWRCICDCGAEPVVCGENLRRGAVKSCGCLRRQAAAERMRLRATQRNGRS